jgi:8-oxo-dGTP pyrophosphatase MutT (NUDIX family)
MICGLVPGDALEAQHRSDTLRWLQVTDDVFRRVKPATPPRHLVSYIVPVDPADGSLLLVDHINAGLWLPPGHVEPDEDRVQTARREAQEELGINADSDGFDGQPAFLTITHTVGIDAGHTDVSMWFRAACRREQPLKLDGSEFREARWWSPSKLEAIDPTHFDPHFTRFFSKTKHWV